MAQEFRFGSKAISKFKELLQCAKKEHIGPLIALTVVCFTHAYRSHNILYYDGDPVAWGMLAILIVAALLLAASLWKGRKSSPRCLVTDHQFFLQGLALMEAGRIKSTKKGCLSSAFERDPSEIERAIHDIQRCGSRR